MTNDLLPCPFCGSDDVHIEEASAGSILGEKIFSKPECMNCGATVDKWHSSTELAIKAWNTRTPNKSAEVDLDALKQESDNTDVCHTDFCRVIDYLAASGHLSTGKGGDEPAAPTQIDAGELEFPYQQTFNAISEAVSVTADGSLKISVKCFQDSFNRQRLLSVIEAARAHLSKLSGG